jgi:hypothetical protein
MPLHFAASSLHVRLNMSQLNNVQAVSTTLDNRPRYTGERFLRERPRVYRKVVELLAEPGMSINQITKLYRVSEHTVRAVRDREAVSIAERKQRLISIFGNVAEIAAERMEELAGTASLRDAGTTAGIATDKLLALSSDPFSQANNHLHVHLEPVDIMGQFNEMCAKLFSRKPLEAQGTATKSLPSKQDPEPPQPRATTRPADASAGEEKDRTKEG